MKTPMILTFTALGLMFAIAVVFRVTCGVFVIQPIGALPEGKTIVYYRAGLNYPFIASADGLQEDATGSVSLLGRGVALGRFARQTEDRVIARLPYSESLYLMTTNGNTYDR